MLKLMLKYYVLFKYIPHILLARLHTQKFGVIIEGWPGVETDAH